MEKYFFGVNTPDVLNCCPNLNSIFAEIACHEKATSTTAIQQTKNYKSNHEHHEHHDNQQTTDTDRQRRRTVVCVLNTFLKASERFHL